MSEQGRAAVSYAADRAVIEDVVAGFAIALDSRDIDGAVGCFAERGHMGLRVPDRCPADRDDRRGVR